MKYVIVRTYSAGVFAGELESRNGKEVVLLNANGYGSGSVLGSGLGSCYGLGSVCDDSYGFG